MDKIQKIIGWLHAWFIVEIKWKYNDGIFQYITINCMNIVIPIVIANLLSAYILHFFQ